MNLSNILNSVISEGYKIEIGRNNITVDNRKITAVDNPAFYNMVKAIQKAYPQEMAQVHQKFEPSIIDIIINKNQILFQTDEGQIVNPGGKPYIIKDKILLDILNKMGA